MRHPRSGRSDDAGNLLQGELLQEKAANLGRLARRLERALRALEVYDTGGASSETPRMVAPSRVPGAASGTGDRVRRASGIPVEAGAAGADAERRTALLADAGEALFLYVVQREVLGLHGTAQALDEMGVPREVRLRMAPRSVLLAR
jgi:hypothetical protein